ncbi:hypothetical protein C8J38_107146 [Rhizobium sp. PP-WC-2G-219]|nr:hypothetical protein C8J38_107146 [Rhizobium sp. PP-WC-2G-219]
MPLRTRSPVSGRRQRFQYRDKVWSRTIGADLLQDVIAVEQRDAAQVVCRLTEHWRIGIRHDPDLVPGRDHVALLVFRNGISAFVFDLHRPSRIGQTGRCLTDRYEVEINDDPARQRRQDVAGRDQHPATRQLIGRKGETDARAASACGRGDLCVRVAGLVRLRCDRQDEKEDEKLGDAEPS